MMTVYAINKRTKEHKEVTSLWAEKRRSDGLHPQWRIVETDADGWIPWSGGECPLPLGSVCIYIMRSNNGQFKDSAHSLWWGHDGKPSDIIAYRPILSDDEGEQPEWNGEGLPPVGCLCEFRMIRPGTDEEYWGSVEVLAHRVGKAVIFSEDMDGEGGDTFMASPSHLRPIRSDEDRAVEEMAKIMEAFPRDDSKPELARLLYRAGYRKQ